jgi:hypothetical protein
MDTPVSQDLLDAEENRSEIVKLETEFLENHAKPKEQHLSKEAKKELQQKIVGRYNREIDRLINDDPYDQYNFGDLQKLINRRDEFISRYVATTAAADPTILHNGKATEVEFPREVVETTEDYVHEKVEVGYHYNDHDPQNPIS